MEVLQVEYGIKSVSLFGSTARDEQRANSDIDLFVIGEYLPTPPRMPAVYIQESDNRVVESMRTTNIENAVSVMYECNVFSNKASGKKSEAKKIASVMDSAFTEIGFTRTLMENVPNFNEASIYRIVCRYEAIVDKNLCIYHN